MSLTCTITKNGNLQIDVRGTDRRELTESRYNDLMERYSCNGSFTAFDAGAGNPCVGMTDAPCVAEEMSYDDEGQAEIIGRLWWYPQYETKDFIRVLKDKGTVIFTLAE